MELKFLLFLQCLGSSFRSNRTFMELKSRFTTLASSRLSSSNRTFMELK